MKYIIEVTRTVESFKAYTITADSEEQAREKALKMAVNDNLSETEENYTAICAEVLKDYVDWQGCPYDPDDENHCWPAGGGLRKECDYNAEALVAFYVMGSREKIATYLTNYGFTPLTQAENYEEWAKGNTLIVFEEYDASDMELWAYVHTELLTETGLID